MTLEYLINLENENPHDYRISLAIHLVMGEHTKRDLECLLLDIQEDYDEED